MRRSSYLSKAIQDLRYKNQIRQLLKKEGFPCYQLYIQDLGARKNFTVYVKTFGRVASKTSFENFFLKAKQLCPGVTLKLDYTRSSKDPRFLLGELDLRLKKAVSITKEVQYFFRRLCRSEELRGIWFRVKGKTNSLRTKTKLFKFGKINYTGNYLKDYKRAATINHATKRGTVGLKLVLYYKEPFQ